MLSHNILRLFWTSALTSRSLCLSRSHKWCSFRSRWLQCPGTGKYPSFHSIILHKGLESYYIPELQKLNKTDIPVQVILNKTDLECEVKRKSVQNLIRKTFPESQVVLAGKGMKSQGGNAAFRNVVRALMNEQRITNELCHLFLKPNHQIKSIRSDIVNRQTARTYSGFSFLELNQTDICNLIYQHFRNVYTLSCLF